jgi:tetratricopeptide (TPR) repeat protein
MKRLYVRWAILLFSVIVVTGCGDPYEEGLAAKEASRYKEALDQLQQVRILGDNYRSAQQHIKEIYFLIGKAAYTREDWDEAEEFLKKVKSDDKVHYSEARNMLAKINFQRGQAAYGQGEWAEATRLLQKVRPDHSAYQEAQALLKEMSDKATPPHP